MIRVQRNIISALSGLALAVFLQVPSVYAQNGINSTVEVERDYEGRIARTVKSPPGCSGG